MRDDDARLIERARSGSTDALRELFDRHFGHVWKTAYRVTGQRALADDAAQEAFVRAFAALGDFDETRPLAPWLARIAANRAIDLLRRERRLYAVDPGELAHLVLPYEEIRADNDVAAAVARLDVDRRVVIVLHYWLDYSLEEIADVLGIPAGTVASRLSRGLADLRSELEVDRASSA
jgi:RNA polymerase sigma-70 factor, ECF subfamily